MKICISDGTSTCPCFTQHTWHIRAQLRRILMPRRPQREAHPSERKHPFLTIKLRRSFAARIPPPSFRTPEKRNTWLPLQISGAVRAFPAPRPGRDWSGAEARPAPPPPIGGIARRFRRCDTIRSFRPPEEQPPRVERFLNDFLRGDGRGYLCGTKGTIKKFLAEAGFAWSGKLWLCADSMSSIWNVQGCFYC